MFKLTINARDSEKKVFYSDTEKYLQEYVKILGYEKDEYYINITTIEREVELIRQEWPHWGDESIIAELYERTEV